MKDGPTSTSLCGGRWMLSKMLCSWIAVLASDRPSRYSVDILIKQFNQLWKKGNYEGNTGHSHRRGHHPGYQLRAPFSTHCVYIFHHVKGTIWYTSELIREWLQFRHLLNQAIPNPQDTDLTRSDPLGEIRNVFEKGKEASIFYLALQDRLCDQTRWSQTSEADLNQSFSDEDWSAMVWNPKTSSW